VPEWNPGESARCSAEPFPFLARDAEWWARWEGLPVLSVRVVAAE
jgi:hypothetical protein